MIGVVAKPAFAKIHIDGYSSLLQLCTPPHLALYLIRDIELWMYMNLMYLTLLE